MERLKDVDWFKELLKWGDFGAILMVKLQIDSSSVHSGFFTGKFDIEFCSTMVDDFHWISSSFVFESMFQF